MSELIGKTIEQYRIDRLLGQGGMAAVYEATDTNLNRQVAVKIMHPHLGSREVFRQRFLREAQAAAILNHPNIVRVLNFGGSGANVILVMELLVGKNLRQYTRMLREQNLRMPHSEALEVTLQIAHALQYAHAWFTAISSPITSCCSLSRTANGCPTAPS
jgi:eukaryotic-like serine/threonine-protein kinase